MLQIADIAGCFAHSDFWTEGSTPRPTPRPGNKIPRNSSAKRNVARCGRYARNALEIHAPRPGIPDLSLGRFLRARLFSLSARSPGIRKSYPMHHTRCWKAFTLRKSLQKDQSSCSSFVITVSSPQGILVSYQRTRQDKIVVCFFAKQALESSDMKVCKATSIKTRARL